MTEHKFTDEKVIRALEHCGSGYQGDVHGRCNTCPLNEVGIEPIACFDTLLHDLSLDLINRQKEEIEVIKETTAEIRYEVVKEFAERLKIYYRNLDKTAGALINYTIDQKLKEFLGERGGKENG